MFCEIAIVIKNMSIWETHPENAKCECACNKFFWSKKGKENPIL
jgi:hypothetical protein